MNSTILERFTSTGKILESNKKNLPEGVLCRAKYQICTVGEKNRNNRIYEREVWERVLVDEDIVEKLKNRSLFFHAEHPATTQSNTEKVAGIVTSLDLSESKVHAVMEVLDTPYGRIVDTLLKAGCGIGVSTRADGELEEAIDEDGNKYNKVVPTSYKFVTVDFTADPSSYGSEVPLEVQRNVTEIVKIGIDNEKIDRDYATVLLEGFRNDEAKSVLESMKIDKHHSQCKCLPTEKACLSCPHANESDVTPGPIKRDDPAGDEIAAISAQHPFGTVAWQEALLDLVNQKIKAGDPISPLLYNFLETQLQHMDRVATDNLTKKWGKYNLKGNETVEEAVTIMNEELELPSGIKVTPGWYVVNKGEEPIMGPFKTEKVAQEKAGSKEVQYFSDFIIGRKNESVKEASEPKPTIWNAGKEVSFAKRISSKDWDRGDNNYNHPYVVIHHGSYHDVYESVNEALHKNYRGRPGWYLVYTNPGDSGDPNYVWEEDGVLLAGNYNPKTGAKEERFEIEPGYKLEFSQEFTNKSNMLANESANEGMSKEWKRDIELTGVDGPGIYCPSCDMIHKDYRNLGDEEKLRCNLCDTNPNDEDEMDEAVTEGKSAFELKREVMKKVNILHDKAAETDDKDKKNKIYLKIADLNLLMDEIQSGYYKGKEIEESRVNEETCPWCNNEMQGGQCAKCSYVEPGSENESVNEKGNKKKTFGNYEVELWDGREDDEQFTIVLSKYSGKGKHETERQTTKTLSSANKKFKEFVAKAKQLKAKDVKESVNEDKEYEMIKNIVHSIRVGNKPNFKEADKGEFTYKAQNKIMSMAKDQKNTVAMIQKEVSPYLYRTEDDKKKLPYDKNDIKEGLEEFLPAGNTEIWYWKDEFMRDALMGSKWLIEKDLLPDPSNLEKDYIKLGSIEEKDLNKIYHQMQGEVWSPGGEARELITELGLSHTSMSVGDVIVVDGKAIMVDFVGFYDLSSGSEFEEGGEEKVPMTAYHWGEAKPDELDTIDRSELQNMERLSDEDLLGMNIRPEDKGKTFYADPEDIERTDNEGTGVKWAYAIQESIKETTYEDMIYKLKDFVKKLGDDDDVKAFFRALDMQDFDHGDSKSIMYAASDALDTAGIVFPYDELQRMFLKDTRESIKEASMDGQRVPHDLAKIVKEYYKEITTAQGDSEVKMTKEEAIKHLALITSRSEDEVKKILKEATQLVVDAPNKKIDQFLSDNWSQFLNDQDAVDNLIKVFKIDASKAKAFVKNMSKGKGDLSIQYSMEGKVTELEALNKKLIENYGRDCVRLSSQVKELKEKAENDSKKRSNELKEAREMVTVTEKKAKQDIELLKERVDEANDKLEKALDESELKIKELKESNKKQILKVYTETKLKCMGLKLNERRLTILESCKSTKEVDEFIREFQNTITESALQFNGPSDISISVTPKKTDPKQEALDRKIGSALSAFTGVKT